MTAVFLCLMCFAGETVAELSTLTAKSVAVDLGAMHSDPIAPVLAGIIIILLAAKAGGHLFESLGLPSVLGELAMGIVLGNLSLAGIDAFEFLKVEYTSHQSVDLLDYSHLAGITLDHLARIGVILLLFQVGLESSIRELRKVSGSAFMVAVTGVVAPAALGWLAGMWMMPNEPWPAHMFLGAALCATSVGITARVLRDMNVVSRPESQIILGAAVIDDVLGLIVLSVTQGIILSYNAAAAGESQAGFSFAELMWILLKAGGFLVAAIVLGQAISRRLFRAATFLKGKGLLIASALLICFGFSWLATVAGLATIVGAFAAGLVLDDVHYADLKQQQQESRLEDLLRPMIDLLVPIFFVEMGLHVDLRTFVDPGVLTLAAALSVAAVLGKQACAFGVRQKGVNRTVVGLGMIPRGEVGLIFAAIGRQLHIGQQRIVDERVYSALVVMVMVTTMVTPPLLKWGFSNRKSEPGPD